MIEAEGTKTRSKMQKPHFLLRCYPMELTQRPTGENVSGRPHRSKATRRKESEGDCPAPTSAGGPEAEVAL
ncbi:hypothetical protein AM500_09040 [Bacillus sp. FJAT-18017]|nr:hypothetical protein AM500_09040 [Bacillus sp. FJAT-18017]